MTNGIQEVQQTYGNALDNTMMANQVILEKTNLMKLFIMKRVLMSKMPDFEKNI